MKHNNMICKCKLGILIVLVCFLLIPMNIKQSLYESIPTLANIPRIYITGIINMLILIVVCLLCGYSFMRDKITLSKVNKQLIGAVMLLTIMLLCTMPFVEFTNVYQENIALPHFIIYQILFVGFYEELLFRGVVVFMISKFLSSDILIALLCPVIFAFLHIGSDAFSMMQVISAFAVGFLFTLLILKLRDYFTIYNIGVVHGVFNIFVLGFSTYMQVI